MFFILLFLPCLTHEEARQFLIEKKIYLVDIICLASSQYICLVLLLCTKVENHFFQF
jgi:hypothetical protein